MSTSDDPRVEAMARQVVAWTLLQPATLGAGRLVCVDGPAGSGKTTLGAALRRAARDVLREQEGRSRRTHVALLHMDDVYEGWDGLDRGIAVVVRDVVAPLRAGRAGRYRRYDWVQARLEEERIVEPVDVLVIEGVGSGAAAYDDAITCLVWVETPGDLRLARGLARDGDAMRDHWLAWSRAEDVTLARERTRDRADVVVDGTGASTQPAFGPHHR